MAIRTAGAPHEGGDVNTKRQRLLAKVKELDERVDRGNAMLQSLDEETRRLRDAYRAADAADDHANMEALKAQMRKLLATGAAVHKHAEALMGEHRILMELLETEGLVISGNNPLKEEA